VIILGQKLNEHLRNIMAGHSKLQYLNSHAEDLILMSFCGGSGIG
jgi:hypothetical protein